MNNPTINESFDHAFTPSISQINEYHKFLFLTFLTPTKITQKMSIFSKFVPNIVWTWRFIENLLYAFMILKNYEE